MKAINKHSETALYCQVVDLISESIDDGTLRAGEKLPSLRHLSDTLAVSVPTVRQAYLELERQRRVIAKPKSGYFVRGRSPGKLVRVASPSQSPAPSPVICRRLIDRVYDGVNRAELVPLGIASPSNARPAAKALHRSMKRVMSRAETRSLGYAHQLGEPNLRRQIAWRYLDQCGAHVDPDTICITNGGQEALLLALKAVAEPGDVIAVESPTYHGILELIDSLGMLAVEVTTCPEDGLCLERLEQVLAAHPVKACVFSSTLSNPLGVSMTSQARQQLVGLLEQHDTWLIEDDVYGELLFDGNRPTPAQFCSDSERIITCGSFSKTVAPSYRIGWVIAGSQIDRVARLKRAFSVTSGLLPQLTLADFIATGDYDRHLLQLRSVLRLNAERSRALVAEHFPSSTRCTAPVGGSVLWLKVPGTSTETLFDQAIDVGISIAPGAIFSPQHRFKQYLRLSFGHPWSHSVEQAIAWLGEACHST